MKRTAIRSFGRKRARLNVAKATMFAGLRFHSRKEADYAAQLDLRKRAIGVDRILSWKPQVRIKLEVNGILICTYVCDFLVCFHDGSSARYAKLCNCTVFRRAPAAVQT